MSHSLTSTSTSNHQAISVRILDREYQIFCSPEEKEDLFRSAAFLDSKMRSVRDSGKVVGLDRIAIITALNFSHELIAINEQKDSQSQDTQRRLHHLHHRLNEVLSQDLASK